MAPTLRIEAWCDTVVERLGVSAQSRYVEQFWLPVLGPSACLLLRRAVDLLVSHPDGCEAPADELARALGLGGTGGRHAPFPRAISRLVRYGMARRSAPDAVAFRRMVGTLPVRLAVRLPPLLQRDHDEWLERRRRDAALDLEGSRRARDLALEVAGAATGRSQVEAHLRLIGIEPDRAAEAARWVSAAPPEGDPAP